MEYLNILRVLSDATAWRLLRCSIRRKLSVAELQEILGWAQSRISMQLSQLKSAGLVEVTQSRTKEFVSRPFG